MVDFGSKISSFVKNETQSFVQKNVNKLAGQLSSMGGGVIQSLIGSVSQGLSQNLLNVGNSFNTIEAVASRKMDGIVAGGAPEFAAGGKCADRSTAADISSMRNPTGESLKSYRMDVFPETVVDFKKSEFNEKGTMTVLAEANDKYYMKMRFYDYERADLFKASKKNSKFNVIFPLPLELGDVQRTDYDSASLKVLGNTLNGGNAEASAYAAAMFAGKGIAGDLSGKLPSTGVLGVIANQAKKISSASGVTPENLATVLEQTIGAAPNPNPSLAFKGPNLRSFTFSWMFNPRDRDESKRIKSIIKKMKAASLPSTVFGSDTGILKYPNMIMVNFYPWDNGSDVSNGIYGWGEESFIRMKRCVIESVNANYAPSGAPSFFEGSNDPTFIQLTLNLKEIEFFVSSDWGGESGDSNISNKLGQYVDASSENFLGGI